MNKRYKIREWRLISATKQSGLTNIERVLKTDIDRSSDKYQSFAYYYYLITFKTISQHIAIKHIAIRISEEIDKQILAQLGLPSHLL